MNSEPLDYPELEFISDTLMKYGNDDSILDVTELDVFLTAVVSGPNMIVPSQWFPELWGGYGREPEWQNEQELNRFMSLIMQHLNNIADTLMGQGEHFECLFNIRNIDGKEIFIVEEWCFGYMRGVELGQWPTLPAHMQTQLEAISLHGLEQNFDRLGQMSLEEHQLTTRAIAPAAMQLHTYFLQKRSPVSTAANQPLLRTTSKAGRNDPCPCGSGKKYKKCCLH